MYFPLSHLNPRDAPETRGREINMSNLYNNYGDPTRQNKLSWLLLNGSSKWKRAGITDETEWRKVSRLTVCPVATAGQQNGSKLGSVVARDCGVGACWEPASKGRGARCQLVGSHLCSSSEIPKFLVCSSRLFTTRGWEIQTVSSLS